MNVSDGHLSLTNTNGPNGVCLKGNWLYNNNNGMLKEIWGAGGSKWQSFFMESMNLNQNFQKGGNPKPSKGVVYICMTVHEDIFWRSTLHIFILQRFLIITFFSISSLLPHLTLKIHVSCWPLPSQTRSFLQKKNHSNVIDRNFTLIKIHYWSISTEKCN